MRQPLANWDDLDLFGSSSPSPSPIEEGPIDLQVDSNELVGKAQEGLQTGLNNAIKKGVKEGAEAHYVNVAEQVTQQVLNPTTNPLKKVKENMMDQLEIASITKAMSSLQGAPVQGPQPAPLAPSPSQGGNEMLAAIQVIKALGLDPKDIIETYGIQGLAALANPAQLPLLLAMAPAQQPKSSTSDMLPMLMTMMQQRPTAPSAPAENGMATIMTAMMQLQQQNMTMMMQMQEQARQQAAEQQQRQMEMMAQSSQLQQQLVMEQIKPYLGQRSFTDELGEFQEKWAMMKQLGVVGDNQGGRQPSVHELALKMKQLELEGNAHLEELKIRREDKKDEQQQAFYSNIIANVQPLINSAAKDLGGLLAERRSQPRPATDTTMLSKIKEVMNRPAETPPPTTPNDRQVPPGGRYAL